MAFAQKLRDAVEFARQSEIIDTQVAQFRKETQDMRQQEDDQRAQRIVKFRREAKWVSKSN
jgi:hypothetical protein